MNSPSKTNANSMRARLALAAFLLMALAAGAEAAYENWEFSRAITGGKPGSPLAVPLPGDVHAAARNNLEDLRVVTAESVETPYAVRTQRESKKEIPVPVTPVSRDNGPEATVMTVSLGEEPRAFNRVAIVPEETNFLRAADVEGSSDGTAWETVRKGILVYAFASEAHYSYLARVTGEVYTGYGKMSAAEWNLSMRVPESRYRFVRVRIPHDLNKEPVGIREVKLAFARESPAKETDYEAKIVSQGPGEPKSTEVVLDLGFAHLPVYRVALEVPEKNFYRQLRLFASEDGQEWRPAGTGAIRSVDLEGTEDRQTEVEFAETEARYLKAVIFNGDNRPVTVARARAFGLTRFLVFIPEAGKTYRLLYGHAGAKAPSYDVAALIGDREPGRFAQGALGPAERKADFKRETGRPWTEERPYLLWAAMGAVALALLFLATRVLQKV